MKNFKKEKLKLLEWPSLSPDLNINENLIHAVLARWPKKLSDPEVFCKEEDVKIHV